MTQCGILTPVVTSMAGILLQRLLFNDPNGANMAGILHAVVVTMADILPKMLATMAGILLRW